MKALTVDELKTILWEHGDPNKTCSDYPACEHFEKVTRVTIGNILVVHCIKWESFRNWKKCQGFSQKLEKEYQSLFSLATVLWVALQPSGQ